MARPIEATPTLYGEDARRLLDELSNHCSREETERRQKRAKALLAQLNRPRRKKKRVPLPPLDLDWLSNHVSQDINDGPDFGSTVITLPKQEVIEAVGFLRSKGYKVVPLVHTVGDLVRVQVTRERGDSHKDRRAMVLRLLEWGPMYYSDLCSWIYALELGNWEHNEISKLVEEGLVLYDETEGIYRLPGGPF